MAKNLIIGFIVLSFLQVPFDSVAQKKDYKGYYININGDSIIGKFPNYAQWGNNPSKVKFQPQDATTEMELTTANCRKFVISEFDEYLLYEGNRLVNPIREADIIKDMGFYTRNDITEPVKTFIRLIARTPQYELYSLSDNTRVNYFFTTPGIPLTELKYKLYSNEGRIMKAAEYLQQLNTAFGEEINNRDLTRQLETLDYKESSLLQFFEQLYPGNNLVKKKENREKGFVVGAGAALNLMNIHLDDQAEGVPSSFKPGVAPVFSIRYIFPLDRNFGRYIFFPQARISTYKHSGEYRYSTYRKVMTFKSDLVVTAELNGGVHLVNAENSKVTLSIGGGIAYLMNNRQVSDHYMNSTGEYYYGRETRLLNLSLVFNAGISTILHKRYLAELRYTIPSAMENFVYYTPWRSSLELTFGYKLR